MILHTKLHIYFGRIKRRMIFLRTDSCIQALESMLEGANLTEISESAFCDCNL
ncbi:unnamed protein product [Acanthoscelides obtectus]|uniref:Uncharacterized protein n=1 Tax=Acanthoscelides obtectus TaxID=200917 RepID=A0A9P0M4M9_ACAOB|nr:unnamed protein product [Acanthoscelides obtectus]CAK1650703.1 hypothetical protein AOBTE_LOCUS16873 [Acanthoscelides obtectus]